MADTEDGSTTKNLQTLPSPPTRVSAIRQNRSHSLLSPSYLLLPDSDRQGLLLSLDGEEEMAPLGMDDIHGTDED